MTRKKFIYSSFLVLVSLWWGWTILIDFVVVPTVFKIIPHFFEAGDLGIALFSRLNSFELVISSVLVALTVVQLRTKREALPLFLLALCSWAIIMFYFSFLTPKIISLTEVWKVAEASGEMGTKTIPDVQQEHQFFHHLYIKLDGLKLTMLSVMLIYGIIKEEKWV